VDRRLGGYKDNSKRYAGEKNTWTGDLVGPRAILNGMQERKTCGQERWCVRGTSERYAGETNMYLCWKSYPCSSVFFSDTLSRSCARKGVSFCSLTSPHVLRQQSPVQKMSHCTDTTALAPCSIFGINWSYTYRPRATVTKLAPNSYATYLTLQS
jgi:hypothetical protein